MAGRRRNASMTSAYTLSARAAWRLGTWATIAVTAVVFAVLAARSEIGAKQQIATPRVGEPAVRGASPAGRPFDAEVEARRLNEAVRLLAADRDRLLARISALERNIDDVTGSIPSNGGLGSLGTSALPPKLAPGMPTLPPVISAPPLTAAPPATGAPRPAQPPAAGQPPPAQHPGPAQPPSSTTSRISSTFAAAVEPGPASSVATKTEFGIDLGGAASVDGLRALWVSVRDKHETLFDGLRPVVSVREGSKPGAIELRLVAGPLANAGAAARLCAALSAAGHICQPAVFDGQRLALR